MPDRARLLACVKLAFNRPVFLAIYFLNQLWKHSNMNHAELSAKAVEIEGQLPIMEREIGSLVGNAEAAIQNEAERVRALKEAANTLSKCVRDKK